MKIIKTILHKGEWLLDALKRMGCNMIPTNTIQDLNGTWGYPQRDTFKTQLYNHRTECTRDTWQAE